MIRVLSKKNHNPNKFPGTSVYVGRGYDSHLGNPFTHLSYGCAPHRVNTVEEAVNSYRDWIGGELRTNSNASAAYLNLVNLAEQGDLNLVCWCAGLRPLTTRDNYICHGQILAEMIERDISIRGPEGK